MFSRIIKNGTNKPLYFKNIDIKPVAFLVFFFIIIFTEDFLFL